MTDTKWADTSKWQETPVDNSYPHPFFCFKASDGGDKDPLCDANHSWSKANSGSGKKMVGYAGYHVYRVGEDNFGGIKRALGNPNDYMTIMLDVEDWNGEIHSNQSSALNKLREQCIDWLGGSRKRVFGYCNPQNGNLQTIWPDYDDTKFIFPNYSSKPTHGDMIGHQYSDSVSCKPWGPCDANIAYGMTPAQWASTIGITPAGDQDMPKQLYLYNKSGQITTLAKAGTWYCVNWDADLANTGGYGLSLPKGTGLFSMSAWLYFDNLPNDYNMYWRIQTLRQDNNTEIAKFPVGEIRGTTGATDLQFSMVGSVSTGTPTNLRILVSATKDNVKITNAWWRTLVW